MSGLHPYAVGHVSNETVAARKLILRRVDLR